MPEDRALREVTLRLVEDRLLVLRRTRGRALVSTSVLVLVTVFLAVAGSPWWWLAVGACAAMLALVLIAPARLRRRAEMLRNPER